MPVSRSKDFPITRPAPPPEDRPKCRNCMKPLKPAYAERYLVHVGADCSTCDGKGQVELPSWERGWMITKSPKQTHRTCSNCKGTGKVNRHIPKDRVWAGQYVNGPYFCHGTCAAHFAYAAVRNIEKGVSIGMNDHFRACRATEAGWKAEKAAAAEFEAEGRYTPGYTPEKDEVPHGPAQG